MIEMTYKGNAKEKDSSERQMIPKNIRQIGEVGKERKVYLEDYAVTYMQQVSMAILLGEIRESGGIQYVFVNGAVGVKSAALEEADWEQLYREVKEHFGDREIIGYYRKMDEEPAEISGEVEELFRTRFSEEGNILVLRDMPENENVIFLVENGLLKKQPGYYIYYEKNQAMQDYMVDHGEGHSVEGEGEVSDKAIKNFRKIIGEKKEEKEPEKKETAKAAPPKFLYAASTFMVLVIAVIGVTIMNNNDKMNRVESTLSDIAKQTESLDEEGSLEASAEGKAQEESFKAQAEKETDRDASHSLAQTETGAETENKVSIQEETAEDPYASSASETVQTEASAAETEAGNTSQVTGETEGAADIQDSASSGEPETTQQTEAAQASSAAGVYQSSYTVKYGDTLANICRMYYGNVDKLDEVCQVNGITDPNTIIMGQKIVLP